jgi:hypothetical protein
MEFQLLNFRLKILHEPTTNESCLWMRACEGQKEIVIILLEIFISDLTLPLRSEEMNKQSSIHEMTSLQPSIIYHN